MSIHPDQVRHLVLLPGMDGTGTLFRPLLSFLPKFVTPIVISYPTEEPLSYDELTEFVKARLPNSPFIILAESFSGPIGLRIAKAEPALLKGLILCATFAKLPGTLPFSAKRILTRSIWFQIRPPSHLLRFFLAGKTASQELLKQMLEVASSVAPQVWAKRLAEVFQVDESETFRNLKLPTLILQAKQDFLIGADTFPSVSSKMIEKVFVESPHMLLQSQPQQAAEIINQFLYSLLRENPISDNDNNALTSNKESFV